MNPEHAYELPPIEGIDKEYAIEKLSRSYQNFCFKVRVPNTREEMLFCPICRRSYSIGYMSNPENHLKEHNDVINNSINGKLLIE